MRSHKGRRDVPGGRDPQDFSSPPESSSEMSHESETLSLHSLLLAMLLMYIELEGMSTRAREEHDFFKLEAIFVMAPPNSLESPQGKSCIRP